MQFCLIQQLLVTKRGVDYKIFIVILLSNVSHYKVPVVNAIKVAQVFFFALKFVEQNDECI